MVQTGDPTGTGRGGNSIWGKKFEDEYSEYLKHNVRGVVFMANNDPNTNGSVFHHLWEAATSGHEIHSIWQGDRWSGDSR